MSRIPKGLQLKVRTRKDPKLIVFYRYPPIDTTYSCYEKGTGVTGDVNGDTKKNVKAVALE